MGGLLIHKQPSGAQTETSALHRMAQASPHLGELHTRSHEGFRIGVQRLHEDADLYSDEHTIVAFTGQIFDLNSSTHDLVPFSAEQLASRYRADGLLCYRHLTGEYVLAIYDTHERTLWIANSLGLTRSLFWQQIGDSCFLASEIRQLTAAHASPPTLRKESLVDLVAYNGPTHNFKDTMFNGIQRLLPPNIYQLRNGDKNPAPKEAYWSPPNQLAMSNISEAELVEQTEQLLFRAVQRSLAGAKSGISVSGGLDSTTVLAMAKKLEGQDDSAGTICGAYSILYPGLACNEEDNIRSLMQMLDASAHGYSASDLTESLFLPMQLQRIDQAVTRSTAYQIDILSLAMRCHGANRHITGAGAELVFLVDRGSCSDTLRQGRWLEAIRQSLFFEDYGAFRGQGIKRFVGDCVFPPGHALRNWVKRPVRPHYLAPQWEEYWREGQHQLHHHRKGSYAMDERRRWLDRYALGSSFESVVQLSNSYGLELRNPYFDRALIDLAFTTPPELMGLGRRQKGLQRKVAERWIPKAIAWQRQKVFHDSATWSDRHLLQGKTRPEDWSLVNHGIVNEPWLRQTLYNCTAADCKIPRHLEYLLLIEKFSERYITA